MSILRIHSIQTNYPLLTKWQLFGHSSGQGWKRTLGQGRSSHTSVSNSRFILVGGLLLHIYKLLIKYIHSILLTCDGGDAFYRHQQDSEVGIVWDKACQGRYK